MLLHIMQVSVFLKAIIAICTLLVTLGLMFNWSHYAAKNDKDLVKFHGMEYDRFMPIKMALIGPGLSYIMLIGLYLMKAGVIGDYFNFYLLLNMWMTPFVDMFTSSRVIADINAWGIIGITFLVVLQSATVFVTYLLTYRDVDVYKIVFLKKDKPSK